MLLAGRPAAGLDSVERLIPENPVEILEPDTVLTAVEVLRWPLRSLADLEGWNTTDATVTQGPAGLVLRRTGPHPHLERAVSVDAATVDAFRVEGGGKPAWVARVFWARDGERFAPERSADSPHEKGHAAGALHEVAVAPLAEWSGRIARLRVDVVVAPAAEVSLGAVVAVRYRPDPERWEQRSRTPWKVELRDADVGDVRKSWLAPRDSPISRAVAGGPNTRVAFDYGVLGRLPGRLCFTVRAAPAAGPPFDLLTRCLEPGDANAWLSASADLAGLPGTDGRLLFSISGDPGNALPVWGNPEIVRPAATTPPNVVLISIDTLRPDRLGIYGYGRPTSPRLDAWAREHAVAFDAAIAAAPWTLPSHVSMLTGLSAFRHGVNFVDPAPAELLTLAEMVGASGYSTLAVTGGGYLAPWVGLHQGFDRFAYWRHRRGPREQAELASNVDRARAWLRVNAERPFFLFFHTYEVHAPYEPRQPYFARFNESALELPASGVGQSGGGIAAESGFVSVFTPIWGRPSKERPRGDGPLPRAALPLLDALYESGIAYADQEIGRLLETLHELGIDRHTLVIITSDHGEALGENGLAGHAYLYDFNLRVPLLLALPNGDHAGTRVAAQVQSIDIVPTVLEALGIRQPETIDGRSLLPLLSGTPPAPRAAWSYAAQSNHGIALRLDDGFKYVFNNDAWPPAHGQEHFLRIDRKSGAEGEVAANVMQRRKLRRELFDRYATDGPPALAITVVNHLDAELRGRIGSPALRPMQFKALNPPPGPLRWWRRGCEFAIPPGRRLELYLEGRLGSDLLLSLHSTIGAKRVRAREQVRLDQLALPAALQMRAGQSGRWTAGGLAADTTGVELAWRGKGRQAVPAQAAPMPDEVREQLRALGYEK
jgi:arylsulfatase